ncbi:flagellar biosynthesis protein FlhF [Tepidibacillus fermentans]|uniref:Flagellar biosynthesis protein FlhF n=1 Tax=Tepidibacillus fermentans TaxID=1281767 RepID=A0A4R3KI75_9BACI|nr:flagellar biosynthesis protein FlhF [Tepidibacillus fermentans]TCS82956.1 flagellar biosynthesis protein FlhF [Tepidibacillus fermentans]
MRVKRYVSNTLPQAMEQIKVELGEDAIILHTKKIKVGGFLGFFGKEKVEVIAAVDQKSEKSLPKNSTSSRQIENVNKIKGSQTVHSSNDSDPNQPSTQSDTIIQEVKDIKKLMVQLMMNQQSNGVDSNYSDEVKEVYQRLIKQGVEEELAGTIISEVIQNIGENYQKKHVYEVTIQKIIEKLRKNGTNKEIQSQTKLIHVVGPTGVGKTTTIAKLAAESVLKHHKKIAFITADTYRIAAVDQLRTYAEILNTPIEVVFSPQDTIKALEKLKDYDLIFMDTAGRNYHNEMYISELNHLLSTNFKSETYLVLSLTHKYEDMLSILERFKNVKIDKLLFTKFDETITYGAIVNIVSKFPYQVSYLTIGQNVPDDIEIFDEEKIAKAILGGVIGDKQ